MGDRIALAFRNNGELSPWLYAHWDGMDLIEKARDFYDEYLATRTVRNEPSNVMFNFCCYLRGTEIADGEYYLYPDRDSCCSPDDNGYWEMDTTTGEVRKV